jgi:putative intracellular protease/amidase
MKSSPYKEMTTEDFNRILSEVMDEENSSDLLAIGGVYEAVAEHFNNEVLNRWLAEQEENGRKLCPICGAMVSLTGETTDGRLIGSCKDAFTAEQWEE